MTDCCRMIQKGIIKRFGILSDSDGESRIVILLRDSNKASVIGNVDNDTIMPEIALFCEDDKVEISGFQVNNGEFLITKLSNITLTQRLNKAVYLCGYSDDIYKIRNLNLVGEE